MSAQADDDRLPDFADVDEDAPTNLVVPDLAGEAGDATVLAPEHPTAHDEAATVVTVDPAGARAGREADESEERTAPASVEAPVPGTATPPPAEPSSAYDEPTPALRVEDRDGARQIALPESMYAGDTSRRRSLPPRTHPLVPRLIILGALVVGAALVGVTFVLVSGPEEQAVGETSPAPVAPTTMPVAEGEPAGTVHATTPDRASNLEHRAADLVAEGHFDEAVGVYEVLLEEQPERREIELALEIVRRRVEGGER